MNNLKIVGISLVVSALVGVVGFSFYPTSPNDDRPIPQDNLGAVPGNSIEGKYFTVGGVEFANVRMNAIATSSVPCVTKNPFNGDAAIKSFTANFSDVPTEI